MLQGLKRAMLAGESLFQNTYSPEGGPGEITLVPGSAGDVASYEVRETELILEKGQTWRRPKVSAATPSGMGSEGCSMRDCLCFA